MMWSECTVNATNENHNNLQKQKKTAGTDSTQVEGSYRNTDFNNILSNNGLTYCVTGYLCYQSLDKFILLPSSTFM